MQPFEMLGPDAIIDGSATDAYFVRTEETLESTGRNPTVVLEVTVDQYPTGSYEVFAGVKDAAELLSTLPVDVDALAEGELFDGGPVMRITGPYAAIGRYETSLLGFLSQASGFATRALRARRAAPDVTLLSFGSRHLHPAIAPVVERSALIGGFDGISHVAAGEMLDVEASGTMPHALLLCFGRGNQEAAWIAFHQAVAKDVPRVALCDTFGDEVEEVLRAVDALGSDLDSVRLDTTSSRRGDYADILREIRWELDARGYNDVEIFATGGIDATSLSELRDVADGFGVGSYITSAKPVEFALDIVEVDGEAIAKRGKLSGVKQVYRTATGDTVIRREDQPAPANADALLQPLVRDGEIVRSFEVSMAKERAMAAAELVGA